jgi:hypothetical protein
MIDMPAALFRGRYAAVVADMEVHGGLPVDVDYIAKLSAQWQALRMFYIRRDDEFGLYDETGSFREERFEQLMKDRGWPCPRTPTGRPAVNAKSLGKLCKHRPELRSLQKLRDQIAELRLGAFINTIGADGFSRCSIMPFWTRSGRNHPQGREKVFLLSLPSWIHGVIKPPPDWGVAALDWISQEPGIAAGLSRDPALIDDFKSGDIHIQFAIRAGLVPIWATKHSHGPTRDAIKPVSLAVNYGMTQYGAAAATGKSLLWAADVLARHRQAYPAFAAAKRRRAGAVRRTHRQPARVADGRACENQQAHADELSHAGGRGRLHAACCNRCTRGRYPYSRADARRFLDHVSARRARRRDRCDDADHGTRRQHGHRRDRSTGRGERERRGALPAMSR